MYINIPIYHRYSHLGGEWFFNWRQFKKERITPNLFIIGAQKCGTSSLHHYLAEHPDVFMSSPLKEPGYYVEWDAIRDYYRAKNLYFNDRAELLARGMMKGYKGQRYFGESSTFYTNGHRNISKAQWLENDVDLDSIKLIYLIRNPYDRIRSHYLHYCRNQHFAGDINQFVHENKESLDICRYGKQLTSYASYLQQTQLHVDTFENLVGQPQSVMNGIYSFLGLSRFEHTVFGTFNAAPAEQNTLRNQASYSREILDVIDQTLKEDWPLLNPYLPADFVKWEIPV